MDYQTLETLRRAHPAWRLLAADHAPLIASFLHKTFVSPNLRTLPQQELAARLSDFLYGLRQQFGDNAFPRKPEQYLDDWAADSHGWLRKYYVQGKDEPHFDLTPSTERALVWLESLGQREFVVTESRLLSVFGLLREITEKTELDPEARIADLEKRKAEIESEIDRVRRGEIRLMEPTQVRERFLQMTATARSLLADFREVEQNFRALDRSVREHIATWEGGKGELLEEILGQRDAIADSDQGKSFRAFWDFLMSPVRQEEFTRMLREVFALDPVKQLGPDRRLLRVHYDWLEAGESAQRTIARLSEQLRRYLDDQALLENRRIMQLIREAEQHALAVREAPPKQAFMYLDEPAPAINLAMDRPLFSPPFKARLSTEAVTEGGEVIDTQALYEQVYVDKARLAANVRRALQTRPQVSLADLVNEHPLEQGLAELVAYLSLATETSTAVIDDNAKQVLRWTGAEGRERLATLPLVIFNRQARAAVKETA